MKNRFALSLLTVVLVGPVAHAEGIRLPGISIDENGIKAPGVEITDDGIKAPGVTIDDSGISAPGVRIDSGERSRIREQRSPGRYDDEFFTEDGVVRRDQFDNMDLRGYNFAGFRLERIRFKDTDLEGADFRGAILERVEFDNVNLEGADFSDAILTRVEFEDSLLHGACFVYATMQRTAFDDSDLTDAIWIGVAAERTDFKNSDRDAMITRGPDQCFDHHTSVGGTVLKTSLFERPSVTPSAVIEEALAKGTDARVDLTVNFAVDSDRIEGEAHAQILEIANALATPGLAKQRIKVEGHTDGDGEVGYNVDLSYRRAIAVVRMLTDQYDIPADRLQVKGYGEDRPIADNHSAEGKALNRRVTLVNLGSV